MKALESIPYYGTIVVLQSKEVILVLGCRASKAFGDGGVPGGGGGWGGGWGAT